MTDTPPIRVLQSFGPPRVTTNPYIAMLAAALEATPGVQLVLFSWRRALLQPVDVVHVHWPEALLRGSSPMKSLARRIVVLLLLVKCRLLRVAIVRTVHNVHPPQDTSWSERLVLRLFDRWTTFRVILNESTPVEADQPYAVIPHGHYRDWFRSLPHSEPVEGRLGYAGLIRRYKGVEQLLESFSRSTAPGLSLRIGGKPSSDDLASLVAAAAATDPRISARLEYLSDEELVALLTESELVVLPYRFMHNSGGVLAALSVDRPVLVPDNEVNRQLSDEVGPGWVHLFTPPLQATDLESALQAVRGSNRSARPALDARSWADTGAVHLSAYQRAVQLRARGLAV